MFNANCQINYHSSKCLCTIHLPYCPTKFFIVVKFKTKKKLASVEKRIVLGVTNCRNFSAHAEVHVSKSYFTQCHFFFEHFDVTASFGYCSHSVCFAAVLSLICCYMYCKLTDERIFSLIL